MKRAALQIRNKNVFQKWAAMPAWEQQDREIHRIGKRVQAFENHFTDRSDAVLAVPGVEGASVLSFPGSLALNGKPIR